MSLTGDDMLASSTRHVHPVGCAQHGKDASGIYAAVRLSGREPELEGDLAGLRVHMRPYQRRAVAWMLSREVAPESLHPHRHPDHKTC